MKPERRKLLLALLSLGATPLVAGAQGVPVIGFLSPVSPDGRRDAFVQGMQALGYVHGRNVVLHMRFAEGRPERLAELALELVRLKVDVLVAGSTIGARAARKATATIPIVFAGSSDPVAGGLVANLARPEGNITGFSLAYGDGFAGKWLDLLKEADPRLSRVAVLWSSSNAAAAGFVKEVQAAATVLGTSIDVHHAADAAQLDAAFAAIAAQALIVAPSPFAASNRRRLIQFAAERRIPAMYFVGDFVAAGGLMSYGPSIVDAYRRAATYVDRILKGAKPSDLPVEQPTRFELAINLRTARALGLKMPGSLLLRADQVLE